MNAIPGNICTWRYQRWVSFLLCLYEPWLYGKQFCPSNIFLEAVSGSSCFYILYFYVLNVKRFQIAYRRTSLFELRLISRGNLLFFVLVNIIIYQLLNWPPRLVVSCQNLESRNTWCEDKRWCWSLSSFKPKNPS